MLDRAKNGGFEARKGKIEIFNLGAGKRVFLGIATLSELTDGGAAWVGEAENFSNFVETFANSVV